MRPQVVRLALLFAAFISAFLIVWASTVPKSFGEFGFYRGIAPSAIASHPPKFAGRAACVDCHSDLMDRSPHVKAGVSCETCHGPSLVHAEDFEKSTPPKPSTRDFCGRCHDRDHARPFDFPQIELRDHNPDKSCVACHKVHEEAKE